MNTSCFACVDGSRCMALHAASITCVGCRFFKTRAQLDAEQQRVNDILAAKPFSEQQYLAGKYHQGKMPWRGKGVRR
jgi:hypothetical protein